MNTFRASIVAAPADTIALAQIPTSPVATKPKTSYAVSNAETVAGVALIPLTLIASVYGMNFNAMPEQDGAYAYPIALILMLVSVAVPFIHIRRKGWLR